MDKSDHYILFLLCLLFRSQWPTSNSLHWIGLSDRGHEGSYFWVDGRMTTWTNWRPGSPNPNINYDCLMIYGEENKLQNDYCEHAREFICQIPRG